MSETLSHHTSEAKRAAAGHSGDSLLSPELDRRRFLKLGGGVVILPYLAKGIQMEGNGSPLPSPTPGSTETPTKEPTKEPTAEPTKNPEVYLFVPGALPVSVGSEDPWSKTRRIQDTEELGNPLELQLHATLEGHSGWVLDTSEEGAQPKPVAYRFAVLPYDAVSGDEEESEEPTYTIVEVRADRLTALPEETLSQLPSPEEFPYEGPREPAEYVHIEDTIFTNEALSADSSSGLSVMKDASPVKFAEGRRAAQTELPEPSRRDALGTLALALSRLFVGSNPDGEEPTQEEPKSVKLKPASGLPHMKFTAIAVPGNQHEVPIGGPYEQVTDISGPAEGGRGEGVRLWEDGSSTGQGFGVLYMGGKVVPYYNIGDKSEAFEIDTSNIDPENLKVTQRLMPDRKTVEIEYTDSSGEIIKSTMKLPSLIDDDYPLSTITYVSEDDLDTTKINKSAVHIPADPKRVTDIITGAKTPAAIQAQRKDRMTSRPDGVLKVDGITTTDGWHLDWYNRHIADMDDILMTDLGSNPTIVFHRGALYEPTGGSNPDDRGSEFAMLINPETDGLPIMKDPQILAWLESRGADARFVIDWRQLPEKKDKLASPVPRDVKKSQVLEALTQASKHKTPDSRIRTVLHGGILGQDGQLDEVTGKINNISTVADELASTLPEDPRVKFDHIPMLSRDTNLDEDGRFNMIHVLTTLNAHERIAMDTVMVSLAPTSGVDDATHFENLRKLAEDCQKIGVELEYMDLGASSITRAQVADLQRITTRGESKVYLAETLNPDRNNANAEPLFIADNRGRLSRTSAYDKAVKSMG